MTKQFISDVFGWENLTVPFRRKYQTGIFCWNFPTTTFLMTSMLSGVIFKIFFLRIIFDNHKIRNYFWRDMTTNFHRNIFWYFFGSVEKLSEFLESFWRSIFRLTSPFKFICFLVVQESHLQSFSLLRDLENLIQWLILGYKYIRIKNLSLSIVYYSILV